MLSNHNFVTMAAFSTLRRFGDNFGNVDVVRQVSFYLNQRDKIAMATSARGVNKILREMLPTATRYVTTVKPNLMSIFSFENGAYSSPIETFQLSEYGNFGNFYQSLITHVGANEDKEYYASWLEHQLRMRKRSARNRKRVIDLYIRDLPAKDEKYLVERLRESVDTHLSDHHCLQYTRDIKNAIVTNTSIVNVSAYSEISSCRCNLFDCISERSTDVTTLHFVGGTCDDSIQMIADYCVSGLKNLSITTADSSSEINGMMVDIVGDAVARVGILNILEIGNIVGDYEEWADGLIHMLDTCPISSLRINETDFEDHCLVGMVNVLPKLTATDVKMTSCDFGDWGKPLFDALFSNTSISWLDLSYTHMGDGSISKLVEMIQRGTLTRLAIGACGVGKEGIGRVLRATTHVGSKLRFISIFDNNINDPTVFEGMGGTSLEAIHVGELNIDVAIDLVDSSPFEVDTRDSDDCCNDGGGVWPWRTKSHVWYMSHDEFLEA